MQKLKVLSLFSGGGLGDLGLEMAGMEIVGQIEIDEVCQKLLKLRWPNVPKGRNVKNVKKEKLPKADVIAGGPPCFPKNTRVLTEHGYVNIQNLKVGDSVLTHKGQFKSVTETTVRKYIGDFYQLEFPMGIKSFICTSEHPILISSKHTKWNNDIRGYSSWFDELQFIEAKDIVFNKYKKRTESDSFSVFPLQFLKESNNSDIDLTLMEFLGFYLAEGWYSKQKRKDGRQRHEIYLGINKKEKGYVEELVRFMKIKSRYNKTSFSVCYEDYKGGGCRAIISSEYLWEIVQQFGSGAKYKTIPFYFLKFDSTVIKSFIKGYFKGDGYLAQNGTSFRIVTTSYKIVEMLRWMILKSHNQLISVRLQKKEKTCVIEGRTVNQSNYYVMEFRDKREKENLWFIVGNYLYVKIKNIKKLQLQKNVYNIGVQEDESYIVESSAVHNCQGFSVAGKQRGKADDRYLWPAMFEIIKSVRPRYVLFENVTGIVKLALDDVLTDLESENYTCWTFNIPACGINAPHKRERIWIIAYSNRFQHRRTEQGVNGKKNSLSQVNRSEDSTTRKFSGTDSTRGCGGYVANTSNTRTERVCERQDKTFKFGKTATDSKGVERERSITTRNTAIKSKTQIGDRNSNIEEADGRAQTNDRNSDNEGLQRFWRDEKCAGEWVARSPNWEEDWRTVAIESCNGGVDDGGAVELDGFKLSKAKHRVERLKILGNGQVVGVVKAIGEIIIKFDRYLNQVERLTND